MYCLLINAGNWLNAKTSLAGFGSLFEPPLQSSFIWFIWQTFTRKYHKKESRDFQKTADEHVCSPGWTFWTSHFSAATLRTTWTWAATTRGWKTPHRPTCDFTEGTNMFTACCKRKVCFSFPIYGDRTGVNVDKTLSQSRKKSRLSKSKDIVLKYYFGERQKSWSIWYKSTSKLYIYLYTEYSIFLIIRIIWFKNLITSKVNWFKNSAGNLQSN